MKQDFFDCSPGRVELFWHVCTLTFHSGGYSGVLGVRTRVIVSLMDLRLELLFWMSACDFCILNECVCVPSFGLAG